MNRARENVNVEWAHTREIYGAGIGVAVIDTGICMHPDFVEEGLRIRAFKDFVHLRTRIYDDSGHGSHVAGIIGGDGTVSRGKYKGIAPKCDIIAIKALNYKGDGNIPEVLAALNWIMENREEYNIRIINLSFGTGGKGESREGVRLLQMVENVWDSGIVVVAAAGNGGPKPHSIAIPGSSRKIITVGASDDNIAVDLMGAKTSDYSGRGPTFECIKKPDIVAPASNIVSCNTIRGGVNWNLEGDTSSGNIRIFSRKDIKERFYAIKSGTSMSTPIVSGAIALLLSLHPEFSPKEVKLKMKEAAVDLGLPNNKQGWGMLDVKRLLS